jgi:hypothetical protein
MIRNKRKLDKFYRKLTKEENLSYKEALAIYEMLHKEALSLGIINSDNILDGLEVDLRIAKAINGLSRGRKANKTNSSKVRRR